MQAPAAACLAFTTPCTRQATSQVFPLTVGAAASDGKMNKATARQATSSSVDAKLAVQSGRDPPPAWTAGGPGARVRGSRKYLGPKKPFLSLFLLSRSPRPLPI